MTELQNSPNATTSANEFVRKHPLAKCEECPLYTDSVFVPSDGPDRADLVLVGEAPGLNEAREGKPFIGASGKLLDQILNHAGVSRDTTFITNTCLCRPKDNGNPPPAAVRACRDRLVSEINSRKPIVVVTLGNFASRTILNTNEGITKLRVGPPKSTSILEGDVKVIPTFHPAASLYNSSAFPDIVTDFEKIGPALGERRIDVLRSWNPPDVVIHDDPSRAAEYLTQLLGSRYRELSVDIEVGTEKDTDLGRADRQSLLCIGTAYDAEHAVVLGTNSLHGGRLDGLLGDVLGTRRIIAQNGKFDLSGLSPYNPEGVLDALFFDTMLAHYCLDERKGTHSLEQLSIEYLGSPDWKTEFSRFVPTVGKQKNYAAAPRDMLYKYNAYDAVNTFRLKPVLWKDLESQGLLGLNDFLVRVSPVLMKMEMNGVGVDLAYNEEIGQEVMSVMAGYLQETRQILERPHHNPNSPQQVKKAFYEVFKRRMKDTRAPTILAIQEKAAERGDMVLYNFCAAHLAFKKESKSYGTYIKGVRRRSFVEEDGRARVHANFNIHGTVTGRLSSNNPNLQNITRGSVLRRQFVPQAPGNILIQADYRQAELRVVCCLARDAYLREVFSDESRDLHSEVAERFYGKGFTKEQRVRAKAVVFGLTYGREAFSLAAEYKMSVRDAQTYINQFFEVIPQTVEWIEALEEQVLDGDDLINPFGRRRRFWLITDKNRKNILKEARSFLPQSTASDICLEAANRLARNGMWDMLRIPVHDALVAEVPQDEARDIAALMKTTMEETAFELMEGYIPFPVDVKMGKNWGELD